VNRVALAGALMALAATLAACGAPAPTGAPPTATVTVPVAVPSAPLIGTGHALCSQYNPTDPQVCLNFADHYFDDKLRAGGMVIDTTDTAKRIELRSYGLATCVDHKGGMSDSDLAVRLQAANFDEATATAIVAAALSEFCPAN